VEKANDLDVRWFVDLTLHNRHMTKYSCYVCSIMGKLAVEREALKTDITFKNCASYI
jgi:hypothetical protein